MKSRSGRSRPAPPDPERVVRLTVERMAYEGRAVGRADGKVCFAWGALPGEQVDVAVEREHRRYDEGRVRHLHSPSPHRIAPACPRFGTCGGCHFLHCAYEEQLRFKKGFIQDAFRPLPDVLPRIEDPEPSPTPFFSRNRAAYSVQTEGTEVRIGFHARENPGLIVSAENCVLQSEAARTLLQSVRRALEAIDPLAVEALHRIEIREGKNTNQRLVYLLASCDGPALRAAAAACQGLCDTAVAGLGEGRRGTAKPAVRRLLLFGKGVIEETLDGHPFEIGPCAFFQTHTEMAEALFRRVRLELDRVSAKRPLELYAGSGVLATLAAAPGRDWLGFEADAEAVQTARRNLRRNGVESTRILPHRVEDLDPAPLIGTRDILVADPPRAGLSPEALQKILRLRIPRMIYLSCQPAILIRDILNLTQPGGYQVDWVKPFDMFPQTTHVETAVSLSL